MTKFGEFDYSQWEKFAQNFNRQTQQIIQADFITAVMNQLGQMFLTVVKDRTPVGQYSNIVDFYTTDGRHVQFTTNSATRVGGNLRRNWKVSSVKKSGSNWIVTISNNTEYGPYVEFGHRTVNGGWVEGQFMLKLTRWDIKEQFPKIIGNKYEKMLKSLMGGG